MSATNNSFNGDGQGINLVEDKKVKWSKGRLPVPRSRRAIKRNFVTASFARRIPKKDVEHCQQIREMFLEYVEQEIRYVGLMMEKKESDARFQSEIDALRQQVAQLKELVAEHQVVEI